MEAEHKNLHFKLTFSQPRLKKRPLISTSCKNRLRIEARILSALNMELCPIMSTLFIRLIREVFFFHDGDRVDCAMRIEVKI